MCLAHKSLEVFPGREEELLGSSLWEEVRNRILP